MYRDILNFNAVGYPLSPSGFCLLHQSLYLGTPAAFTRDYSKTKFRPGLLVALAP